MKIKERALSLLLSLVMVLTFMPTLAFADYSWSAGPKQDVLALQGGTVSSPGTAELEVIIDRGDYSGEYSFKWYKVTEGDGSDIELSGTGNKIEVNEAGNYYCVVTDGDSEEYQNSSTVSFYVEDESWEISNPDNTISFDGSPATLTVNISGSPYGLTYEWSVVDGYDENDDPIWAPVEGTTNSITATRTGYYECLVSDGSLSSCAYFSVERAEWEISNDYTYVDFDGTPVSLTVDISGNSAGLSYAWYAVEDYDENDDPIFSSIEGDSNAITVSEAGEYKCIVSDGENSAEAWFRVAKNHGVSINGVWYELINYDNESLGAEAWPEGASGNVSILATVTLSNGKAYPVTKVSGFNEGITSINIPASVKEIYDIGLRFVYNEQTGEETYVAIPGFVIYGTNGSPAWVYANQHGVAFRDLAAEAAAALNGTQIGGLPKVKISKPKAAKKAVTVKWKKLKKKQLKTGVTNIEVWIATDSQFTNLVGQPRIIGKKKSSLKIKGLQKGVTYYVKVRAIKNVGGVKYYSAWSGYKTVKVKK